jgi:hypothetical protein
MKIIRPGLFLALLVLLALTDSAISQPASISWPEAVAQLAGEVPTGLDTLLVVASGAPFILSPLVPHSLIQR